MSYLLFIFYFFLLIGLILKTPFIKQLPVAGWILALLFAIKVAAGLYYGWFFTKMHNYQQNADTWRMYYESLEETKWMKTDFRGFIADLFSPRYKEANNILASQNSYWNDIKSVLVVKMMAVCNLLSGGRYYVNVLFFEYLAFLGPVAISRLFLQYFPEKKWLIIAGAFLFPSTLLWCSGFHKEGLLLTTLALAAWLTDRLISEKKFSVGKGLLLAFVLFISFLLRNSLTAFFLLWSIPWWLVVWFPKYRWQWFAGMAVGFSIAFFVSAELSFLPNLPNYLAVRQQEFLNLSGESLLPYSVLEPGLKGYMTALPAAIMNGFIQPLSAQAKKFSYLPAAVEILFFLMLLVYTIIIKVKNKRQPFIENQSANSKALKWFCVCFAASTFLLTGYTIPFLGAIVRYKSVVWPFMILPLIVCLPDLSFKVLKKNK